MKIDNKEIFIPGPCGRIQARYFKNKQRGTPVALVLHPHPQYEFYAEAEAADQKWIVCSIKLTQLL